MSTTNFQLTKGIKYMLISTLCFSTMQSLVKYSPEIPIFEHIFFRSIIGWLLCVFFLKKDGVSLLGKNNKMLIFRGLVGSGSMFSFFYLLSRIPFGTAVAFKYLSPVFTTALAVLILKEKLKFVQWIFLLISFSGILLVKGFDPRISFSDLTIGLLAAFSGGLLFIIIRKIGEDDHHLVILHYFMLISTLISGILCVDNFVWPNLFQAAIILVIGLIGFTAQNFFTIAIQQQDQVSFLSILRYTEAIYALIIGYLWFNETYSYLSMLGMCMIFFGVVLSMKYKSDSKKIEI